MAEQDLLFRIGAEEDYQQEMKQAREAVEGLTDSEKKAAAAARQHEEQNKRTRGSVVDLNAALEVGQKIFGAVERVVSQVVDQTVGYAASVRDLSRDIGANAEETSKLIQVADDVNLSAQTLRVAFKELIKDGTTPSIESLKEIAAQYQALPPGAERSAFALEKFGRSGLEMGKLLEIPIERIGEMAEEAEKAGLVLSDADVASAREYEIALDTLSDTFQGLAITLGKQIIPFLTKVVDAVSQLVAITDKSNSELVEMTQSEDSFTVALGAGAIVLDGANRVRQAFIENQAKMREELIAGRMSLDDYNAGVEGTARAAAQGAIDLGNINVAVQIANQDMQLYSQNLLDGIIASEQYGHSEAELATNLMATAAAAQTAAPSEEELATQEKAAAAAAAEQKAAAEAVAKSLETQRKAAEDAAIAHGNLAEKLKDATKAEFAQAALDALQQSLKEGSITQGEYTAAQETIGLKYGIVTEQSLASAGALESLNQLYENGVITDEQYASALGEVDGAARDGTVTLGELGLGLDDLTNKMDINGAGAARLEWQFKKTARAAWDVAAAINAANEMAGGNASNVNLPSVPGTRGKQSGGAVFPGMGYSVHPPELFFPRDTGFIMGQDDTRRLLSGVDRMVGLLGNMGAGEQNYYVSDQVTGQALLEQVRRERRATFEERM